MYENGHCAIKTTSSPFLLYLLVKLRMSIIYRSVLFLMACSISVENFRTTASIEEKLRIFTFWPLLSPRSIFSERKLSSGMRLKGERDTCASLLCNLAVAWVAMVLGRKIGLLMLTLRCFRVVQAYATRVFPADSVLPTIFDWNLKWW